MATRKRCNQGHIEERPNGSFRVIVYAGRDPLTGKDRRLGKTRATYAVAQVELVRLQGDVHAQRHPRSNITVTEALAQWLEVADHQATTRERYDDLTRLYFTPTLGATRASAVDAQLLERFYARLQRCRDLCSGGPCAGHDCRPLGEQHDPQAALDVERRVRSSGAVRPGRRQSGRARAAAGVQARQPRPTFTSGGSRCGCMLKQLAEDHLGRSRFLPVRRALRGDLASSRHEGRTPTSS
jgi:hypothetical protein